MKHGILKAFKHVIIITMKILVTLNSNLENPQTTNYTYHQLKYRQKSIRSKNGAFIREIMVFNYLLLEHSYDFE